MKPKHIISVIIGVALIVLGIYLFVVNRMVFCLIPCVVGASLVFLGYRRDRVAVILFGHVSIIIGCFLTTWGIYLAPYSEPTPTQIFTRPLFWGLFSIFGGICAIYHGFCRCVSGGQSVK
ncbi:MAG: hypothetical protein PHY02_07805 [Phycisphaerae bacterium]|nr:hypothetical protein [Phycisphaerae bacterium]